MPKPQGQQQQQSVATDSKTMKAVVLTEYKAWEKQDFTPVSVPIPVPQDGQVLIKVAAASINPIDWKVAEGFTKPFGWAQPNPLTPGYDLAGTVAGVGKGVKDFKVGDEVFAVNWSADRGQAMGQHDDNAGEAVKGPIAGAFAEYCLMPAAKVSRKDSKVSFEEAAAVALVGTTAMQTLRNLKVTGAGSKLMVLGGAGAVGHVAIQLAKSMGATVTTTASSRTKDYVKQSGADFIVNYREAKWEDASHLQKPEQQLDAVLDAVGEEGALDKAGKVVKQGGRFLTIANFDPSLADPTKQQPRFDYAGFYLLKNNVKDQDKLMAMLASGQLKIKVDQTFPFTKAGITKAFEAQASGKSMGKNVIVF